MFEGLHSDMKLQAELLWLAPTHTKMLHGSWLQDILCCSGIPALSECCPRCLIWGGECSALWPGLQLLKECAPLAKTAGAACLAQEEGLYKAETNAHVSLMGWCLEIEGIVQFQTQAHVAPTFCLPSLVKHWQMLMCTLR